MKFVILGGGGGYAPRYILLLRPQCQNWYTFATPDRIRIHTKRQM